MDSESYGSTSYSVQKSDPSDHTPDNYEKGQKKNVKKKEKALKKNFLSNIGYQFERSDSRNSQQEIIKEMANNRDIFKEKAKIWCCKLFKYQKLKQNNNIRDAEKKRLNFAQKQLKTILTQFGVLESELFKEKSKFVQRIQRFIDYVNHKAFVDYCYSDKQSNYDEVQLLELLTELCKDLISFKEIIQKDFL